METRFCNYGDTFDVSSVLGSRIPSTQKANYLETSEMDDGQNGDESFEAWMEALEKKAVNRHGKTMKVTKC